MTASALADLIAAPPQPDRLALVRVRRRPRDWRGIASAWCAGEFPAEWLDHEALLVILALSHRSGGGGLPDRLRPLLFERVATGQDDLHETRLQFWSRMVRALLERYPAAPLEVHVEKVLEAFARRVDLPLDFWTLHRWLHPHARYGWLAPDRQPLPG